MIENGLIVTIVGMGTVFMFLTLLVVAMSIMSKTVAWVGKFMPEVQDSMVKIPVKAATDEDIAVAIAVAKINM
ncbi:OadG family protein [bacterium]|nr:OadG family protein [bacterium]